MTSEQRKAPVDAYDELFYQSLCLPRTHPDHLAALGRLMGLDTADPEGCRVLELGCASGGNLIPMAYRLPKGTFVGVDLSVEQIAAGRCFADGLGLGNIDLRAADIANLRDGLAEFDYVIAHGVYSWVSDAVRLAMLALARRVLAPNGLFYVSFNTLPGWRLRGMLIDILQDAGRGESDAAARLSAAQAALTRLERALPGLPGLSAEYLRAEIANLRALHPTYLYFEYLAEHNRAFLFREFLTDIEGQGLRYLCDANLHRQFPATLGDTVDAALADLSDGADLEQWLDFVGNRNFRESLLIRDDADCDEQLSLERFAGLCFSADLSPPPTLDLRDGAAAAFRRADGESVDVQHPLTKALLSDLAARYPEALMLAHLLSAAQHRVQCAGGDRAGEVDALLAELFSLFARGFLRARIRPRRLGRGIAQRPCATTLARTQVSSGQDSVATVDHGSLGVDGLAASLIGYLDGKRTLPDVVEQLASDLESGALRPDDDAPCNWTTGSRHSVAQACNELVAMFWRYGLLEQSCDD
ncbi:MAG: methyltransferase regulatory domain-containing protein [Thiohalocapsa sp.]